MLTNFSLDADPTNIFQKINDLERRLAILESAASTGLFEGATMRPPGSIVTDFNIEIANQKRGVFRGFVNLATPAEVIIDTGVIYVSQSYHSVETEGGAGTDNLDTINGGTEGDLLILRAADSTHTVVVRDNIGNIQLNVAGSFSLTHVEDTLTLLYNGSDWLELSRSDNTA